MEKNKAGRDVIQAKNTIKTITYTHIYTYIHIFIHAYVFIYQCSSLC